MDPNKQKKPFNFVKALDEIAKKPPAIFERRWGMSKMDANSRQFYEAVWRFNNISWAVIGVVGVTFYFMSRSLKAKQQIAMSGEYSNEDK
mmetsp:Transcript_13815/g.15249  ORF Transcript_13815/g.15249 Transcript_13815/m.15249 type:complete len:90 (-) Transcript_13815:126-395(-)